MSFLLHLLHFNLVPTQSPIFALGPDIHVNLSADYCISASKLSLLFASNIVFCHSNVAKWEIMGGPILKSFPVWTSLNCPFVLLFSIRTLAVSERLRDGLWGRRQTACARNAVTCCWPEVLIVMTSSSATWTTTCHVVQRDVRRWALVSQQLLKQFGQSCQLSLKFSGSRPLQSYLFEYVHFPREIRQIGKKFRIWWLQVLDYKHSE